MKKPVNGSKSSMLGSATPGGLKDDPRVKASWALYISKFITAYKKKVSYSTQLMIYIYIYPN